MIAQENPNIHWSQLFVDGLAQSGLTAVVIAPGSRSTPLTLAFHAHPAIRVHLHLDERSAGFLALGIALATDQPVALVCTSGTAVANFLPAIIEARMSQVPLLILSTDRPHELRHSGANQTIDQVKLFGDQVLWAVDMPVPQQDATPVQLRHLHTTAVRAYTTANGQPKGPVHLNFPFRPPLEPAAPLPTATTNPTTTRIEQGEQILTRQQQIELAQLINQHPHGLIVCGPRCPGDNYATAVRGLAEISGYPILADPISGIRFGGPTSHIIGSYETLLQLRPDWPTPDLVLRFGALPTSKWLNSYLNRSQPSHRLHIRNNGVWADDAHNTTRFIQANDELACYQIAQHISPRTSSDWLAQWQAAETAVWQHTTTHNTPLTDFAIVADILHLLPPHSHLFAGNSLAIRHVDQFGQPSSTPIHAHGNRGASGIDGNTSTALGIATATQQPTVAILGDITFLHDLNGLFPLKNTPLTAPFIIVLLNNNSGGIFHRLPIAQIEPPFTDLFLTPHNLQFEPVIRMFGLDYLQPKSQEQFQTALTTRLSQTIPCVIEIQTNGRTDETHRRQLLQRIQTFLPST